MKDSENTFSVHNFKQPITLTVHLSDDERFTVLKNKNVEITTGGRGLKLVKMDGGIYPVKTKRESLNFKEERKFTPAGALLIVILGIADYIMLIWNLTLQTGQNYFNAVTIITMIFGAGFAYLAFRTLVKQREYHLFLNKQKAKFVTPETGEDTLPLNRTIIKNKGFDETGLLVAAFIGVILGFIINLGIFNSVQLSLVDTVDQSSRWIWFDSAETEKVVNAYIAQRAQFQTFMFVGIGILVVVIAVWITTIIIMRSNIKKARSTNTVYMGDAPTFNKKTGKFKELVAYYDAFENDQVDYDTLLSVVTEEELRESSEAELTTEQIQQLIQKDKDKKDEILKQLQNNNVPRVVTVEATGEEYKPSTRNLVFEEDKILRKGLSVEKARKQVNERYENLKQSYEGILVKNILDEQAEDNKLSLETNILQFQRMDKLQAENRGYQQSLKEAHDTLERLEIFMSGAPESADTKKFTSLEKILGISCIVFIVGFIIALAFALGNKGVVTY